MNLLQWKEDFQKLGTLFFQSNLLVYDHNQYDIN